jgi:hypothetical protein
MNLITSLKQFVLKNYLKLIIKKDDVPVLSVVPKSVNFPKPCETIPPSPISLHGSTTNELPKMIFVKSISQNLISLGIMENEAFLRAEIFDWRELPEISNKKYYFHGLGYWWNA